MDSITGYLGLDAEYLKPLGGLHWSPAEDAVLYPEGGVLAFVEEIALFLEGFAGIRPLVHFAMVLHALFLLQNRADQTRSTGFRVLRRAYKEAGRNPRNAGALFGVLCTQVPSSTECVQGIRQLSSRLRRHKLAFGGVTINTSLERCPLTADGFEYYLLEALQNYSEAELRSWLRHGQGPEKSAGEALAQEVPTLPAQRTLDSILAELLERPRLAGAAPFMAQMVSALSLPPRKLAVRELPVGGYADLTMRGQPEQILASQFALDEEEFIRRLAQQELLYYHREEPPTQHREEVVVVLDQGVRTWGRVRLALCAAALALVKQSARRHAPLSVATTSTQGDRLDLLQTDPETLARALEASDLSPSPGQALERVLLEPAEQARDVVLLTHPRNLGESDLVRATRQIGEGVRLFALTLDDRGSAGLSEFRPAGPIARVRFQVDWEAGQPRPGAKPAMTRFGRWQGDVEPIGFPFRFGVAHDLGKGLLDFDAAGDWLLAATEGGMLYAWKTDGSEEEILPRGQFNGEMLTKVLDVIGVAGGFVVAGALRDQGMAFHYDFAQWRCQALPLGKLRSWWSVEYAREAHSLVIRSFGSGDRGCAIDLTTGERFDPQTGGKLSRARTVWLAAEQNLLPARRIPIGTRLTLSAERMPSLDVDLDSGQLSLYLGPRECISFKPLSNGQPLLKGYLPLAAQLRATTLALQVSRIGPAVNSVLYLFQLSQGRLLAEFPSSAGSGFALSNDGSRLAHQVKQQQMEVIDVTDGSRPVFRTSVGRCAADINIEFESDWLVITHAEHIHIVGWKEATLHHSYLSPADTAYDIPLRIPLRLKRGSDKSLPQVAHYDRDRFRSGVVSNLQVVVDRYGQVAILDRADKLVCMFFVFRKDFAAWLPDGTIHGPPSLTGGPPSDRALERIRQALKSAGGGYKP
jgi:hypothetical protein